MVLFFVGTLVIGLSFLVCFSGGILPFGCFALRLGVALGVLLGCRFTPLIGILTLLVYLGGLMVRFAYFLAICPNQRETGVNYKWAAFCTGVGVVGFLGGGMTNYRVAGPVIEDSL